MTTTRPVSTFAGTVGALGVVFGDIGTSPLYALRTMLGDAGTLDRTAVLGVTSLVVWSLLLVVTGLYVGLLLRVDNDGEGGLLALVALLRRQVSARRRTVVTVLGMVGAAMFLGDSVITPAISVLSAAEGLEVASPSISPWVVPLALVLLLVVFATQRAGSGTIGRVYGPVMVVWFVVLALSGAASVGRTPEALSALSPHRALLLFVDRPLTAFLCLGAVILAITGAEALYADLGHFGRRAVTTAWLSVVLPALVLAYLGEAAAVLRSGSSAAGEPFYAVVPGWAHVPVVVLATAATLIASEAVIAGAFTVVHQAGGLGLLPSLRTAHTSRRVPSQIYLPAVNWTLACAVLATVLLFRDSDRLSGAYGVAVAGTMAVSATLLVAFLRWRGAAAPPLAAATLLQVLVAVFLAATLPKVVSGGWAPVAVGIALMVLMGTWWSGRRSLDRSLTREETRVDDVVPRLLDAAAERGRAPDTTVFLTHDASVAPVGLLALLEADWRPSEHVVLLSWRVEDSPGSPATTARVEARPHDGLEGLLCLDVRLGYRERLDAGTVLDDAAEREPALLDGVDADSARFVASVPVPRLGRPRRTRWARRLFIVQRRLAGDPVDRLALPRPHRRHRSRGDDLSSAAAPAPRRPFRRPSRA